MRGARLRKDDRKQEPEADRQTASLGGLALVLLLVVLGLFLVRALQIKGHIEDCLLAGRRDCDTAFVHR